MSKEINTNTRIGCFLECSRYSLKEKYRLKQVVWFKPQSSMYTRSKKK